MLAYLSGSIEFAPEYGKGWRRELRPWLEQALGHHVYDPAEDEKKNLTDDEVANFRGWKTSDPDRFRQTVRKIIDWDMDFIEQRADYVICFWDGPSAGTTAELTAAYRRGIPVYLVTEQATTEISGWVLGCVERTFGGFDELKVFLSEKYGA